ncbi:hypothetical protein G3A46_08255 [Aequorivita sp. KMM 9714]|nr:hypothetical protein [Aequorivita sp. KMM 9714]
MTLFYATLNSHLLFCQVICFQFLNDFKFSQI